MKMFQMKDGEVTKVAELGDECVTLGKDAWIGRHEIKDFEAATALAASATRLTGETYLPVDQGSGHWPRYDVVKAPKVGDVVSRGFNGDYYPVGTIVKITHNFKRVECNDGTVFWRRKNTGGWRDGGFWMVQGTRDERNPSF